MIVVSGTDIYLTRGNSLSLSIGLYRSSGPYTPASGDVITFALKKDYNQKTPLIKKTVNKNQMLLTLEPADTSDLPFGNYVYDIKITMADGKVDTFIKGKFAALLRQRDTKPEEFEEYNAYAEECKKRAKLN